MAFSPHNSKVVKDLVEAGIIPNECRRFELVMQVEKPILIRSEVFASEEQVEQIAEALKRHPEEAQRIAREIIFKQKDGPATIAVADVTAIDDEYQHFVPISK